MEALKKTKKVLIVEDDANFRSIVERSFRNSEFLTIGVPDATHALQKIKEESPDLIILDILLPDMDGVEWARKIRKEGIKIPIIYLTNVKDDAKIAEAMMIDGAQVDYIIKSEFNVTDIVNRARKRLALN